jgi:hypothetical protein
MTEFDYESTVRRWCEDMFLSLTRRLLGTKHARLLPGILVAQHDGFDTT